MFMQRFRTKEWINEWITQIWNLGYRILCYLFWSAEYTHFCYCYTISNTDCREIWKLYFLMSSDHSFCNSFSHEICSMKNARISYSFLLISQGANLWHSTPTYFFSITNSADKEAIILARKAIPIHIMRNIYLPKI